MLSEHGVPRWAQVTGNDDASRPRLFAWVDENSGLHARLIDDASVEDLRLLAGRASEVLSGEDKWSTHREPTDLKQSTALAIVHEHAVGHGSLGRSEVRPLAEVVDFALSEIQELMREGPR